MKRTITGRIVPEIIKRTSELGINFVLPTTHIFKNDTKDNAIPESIGVCIGRGTGESLKSYISGDKDGSILRKCIDNELVVVEYYGIMKENTFVNTPHYFIMYEIDECSIRRPTYTEESCGYGMPISGHYKCEYEILLADDGNTRSMVFTTESVNISMYGWLQDLDNEFENLDHANSEIQSQFFKSKDGEWMFTMFDPVGMKATVEFDVHEFFSMIVSIRQLSCEFVDGKSNL